ncbi:MAG: DUF4870 domain-containing protein [Bacteroidales bacterium]
MSNSLYTIKVNEHDAEKASNSYLMSMVAIMAGLGLPLFNLIATFIFYMANRKESYYVRWHCTQALLSQLLLVLTNGVGFAWLMSILFGGNVFNNHFFAYLAMLLAINLTEFIATIITAIKTRKGGHIEWWFLGALTHLLVQAPQPDQEETFVA